MTAIAIRGTGRLARAAGLVAALAVLVGLRWAATVTAVADAVPVGLVFCLGLLLLLMLSGWRPAVERQSSLATGLAGGAVLVGLAVATRASGLPSLAPPGPFVPWAAVTILVATAEEAVLRGALFDELGRDFGVPAAALVTTAVFALMHVPLYGWQVVPLDLGVGLWLAGLRLATGGVVAPAIAHAVADLAVWWL